MRARCRTRCAGPRGTRARASRRSGIEVEVLLGVGARPDPATTAGTARRRGARTPTSSSRWCRSPRACRRRPASSERPPASWVRDATPRPPADRAHRAPGSRAAAGSTRSGGAIGTDFDAAADAPAESAAPRAAGRSRLSVWISRYWLLAPAARGARRVVSVVVRHVIYPALSWNRDESTYLWQVHGPAGGSDLLTTTGGLPAVLPTVADRRHATASSSRSTPSGWPGVMLVADVLFGSPAASIVWGTAPRGARHVRVHPRGHPRPRALARDRRADAGVADGHHPERACTSATSSRSGSACCSAPRCSPASRRRSLVAPGRVRRARSASCSSPVRSTPCCGPSPWAATRSSPPGGEWDAPAPRRRARVRSGSCRS